jgi:integrase
MGTVYKRGKTWWIKYYHNGKPIYESAKSEKKMVARKLLDQREGNIANGKAPGVHFEKVTFEELATDYLTDYRINEKRTCIRAEQCLKHLNGFFCLMRAPDITSSKVAHYMEQRLSEGATNATINRELSALKRMFSLAAKQTPPKVAQIPYVPMLKENNVRKGFFEYLEFLALRDALPEYLKGFVTFAYKTGWRSDEIRGLTWSQVDRQQGIVWLEVGMTKNEEGRTIYLDDELKEIFDQQWRQRKERGALTPYAFPNAKGTGKIATFQKPWAKACQKAQLGHRLFHDFRRTAVRNMVRSGIGETVAMKISGHKTRSVFDRYNIVSPEDLKQAAQRQEAYLKEIGGMVTNSVTIHDFPNKKGAENDA